MKKMLLYCLPLFAFPAAMQAQPFAIGTLQVNQVKASILSNGDLFWDHTNSQFEVPAGSGKHSIYAGSLWIGGLDAGGQLHMAGQTYRQTGNDFFGGPVSSPSNYNAAYDNQWAQTWAIRKSMIDSFRLGLYGSTPPSVITNWPGNGNTSLGQAAQLAPFVDVNSDGVYDPAAGDYPCIKGDAAVFFMFNDDRNTHTETGGLKFGLEVHGMLYGYSSPGTPLDSTVFINFKIINRSANNYAGVSLGHWVDFDLGAFSDDYVGCDVGRSMFYAYNGDADDGNSPTPGPGTYGQNPPAEGVVLLNGPDADTNDSIDNDRDGTVDEAGEQWALSRFVYYNNDFSVIGNPVTPGEYYNYLLGKWKDSTYVTYGGNGYATGLPAWFMFPDNSDPLGWGTNFTPQAPWSETTAGNIPGDRRGMGSCGPFTFSAGEEVCLDYAYIFGRTTGGGPHASISVLKNDADSVRNFYNTTSGCTCSAWPLPSAVQELQHKAHIGLFPNPASDLLTMDYTPQGKTARYEILDVTGKVVLSGVIEGKRTPVDVSNLAKSVYFVKVTDASQIATGRFVRQ